MPSPTLTPEAPVGAARAPASPLWAVLVFSFVSSLGTGVVTTGIYFIAENGYRFSKAENFWLALTNGVMYILGAAGAGAVMRRLRRAGLSSRGCLVLVVMLLGVLCGIPIATRGFHSQWTIWALLVLYSPLTGVLWPVVESYLSGGRHGAGLRSALGRFNITWASALVIGLVAIGPTAKVHAAELIAALGVIHFGSLVLLVPMGREPGEHSHEDHAPHPVVYTQLLTTFRILLPTSYAVLTALNPYLPRLLGRVGFEESWRAPLAATWTAARVCTFVVMERWHGWEGRWRPAVFGVGALLGGVALAVMSPALGGAGPVTVILGLFVFGTGMATIYTAALYYALEVGKAEVDAGGTHEALIGLGYSLGPGCGLAALALVRSGVVPSGAADRETVFDATVLVIVTCVSLVAVGYAARRSWGLARGSGRDRAGA
jgi:hypothetical protein